MPGEGGERKVRADILDLMRESGAGLSSEQAERVLLRSIESEELENEKALLDRREERAHALSLKEHNLKIFIGSLGLILALGFLSMAIYSAPSAAIQSERVNKLIEQFPGIIGGLLGGAALGSRYTKGKE